MKRSAELPKRLRELFLNGSWIANTNYRLELDKTDWSMAILKMDSLNSIAALVFHVNYYLDGLNRAIETGVLDIRDKYSYDMEPLENEEAWKTLRDQLLKNAFVFAGKVESLDDEQLEGPFISPQYGSYARNIEGVLEHSYYHLGQIVMLGKLFRDK